MSVLVKGVEMPENCCICWFSSHDMCLVCGKDADDWLEERPEYCPLSLVTEAEWITFNPKNCEYRCSRCGHIDLDYPYCAVCGSKMKRRNDVAFIDNSLVIERGKMK